MGQDPNVYLILTTTPRDRRSSLTMARDAIDGGISWLQLRDKERKRRDLLPLGRALRRLCTEGGVTLIVNDDPLLAHRIGADGVHLGQEDLCRHPINETRRLLGRKRIIGLSTHALKEAQAAMKMDVDYIAFGPIFPTPTKPYHLGTDEVQEVLSLATKPVVLIGGINPDNIAPLIALGGRYFAMIRGILEAEDIRERVRLFRTILQFPER